MDIYLDAFFFEFFDPVLLMYDDFDYEVKNSANILSNALFDYYLINMKKISKTQTIVKQMMKIISEYKNTSS